MIYSFGSCVLKSAGIIQDVTFGEFDVDQSSSRGDEEVTRCIAYMQLDCS